MGGGAMLHLGLLMVLVPQGQATGAALAYAIPTMLGYAVLAVMADKGRTTRRR
jgi:O-antigen/teichoic acid export membrane protein